MRLPKDLEKWRDTIAKQYSDEHDGSTGCFFGARYGVDALFAKLCESRPEFDPEDMKKRVLDYVDMGHFRNPHEALPYVTDGALLFGKMIYDESRAHEAALHAEIKRLNYNYELLDKEKDDVINNQDESRWAWWRKRSGELLARVHELEAAFKDLQADINRGRNDRCLGCCEGNDIPEYEICRACFRTWINGKVYSLWDFRTTDESIRQVLGQEAK